jgi:ATPase subunit of ABC transporter with duplicated ATPase domains
MRCSHIPAVVSQPTPHEEYQCAFHMGGGAVVYRIGERFNISDGEAVFLNPWTRHSRDVAPGVQKTILSRVDRLTFAEQRHVEIARAIVSGPRLLLLDEPPA